MTNDTRQALAVALENLLDAFHEGNAGATRKEAEGYVGSLVEAGEAVLAALSAQPVATDETGWLIEHSGEILPGAEQRAQVSWLRVQMKFNGYGAREFGFTHDANEALRFARREDAEAVLAMHLGARPPDWYSKPFSVTEHMWPATHQPQAAPAPDPWPFEHGTDEAGTLNIKPTAPAPEPSAQAGMTDTERDAAIAAMAGEDEARKEAFRLCAGCKGSGVMGRCAACPYPGGWCPDAAYSQEKS